MERVCGSRLQVSLTTGLSIILFRGYVWPLCSLTMSDIPCVARNATMHIASARENGYSLALEILLPWRHANAMRC